VAGELAQVPHDQEIGVEAHLVDHAQFVVQPGTDHGIVGSPAVAPAQAALAQVAQVSFGGVPRRYGEDGQVVAVRVQAHVAHFGDAQRVGQRLRYLAKQPPHLLSAAQVKGLALKAQPVLLGLDVARLDAQQGVVRVVIFFEDVVHVIGGDERHLAIALPLQQPAVEHVQLLNVVML